MQMNNYTNKCLHSKIANQKDQHACQLAIYFKLINVHTQSTSTNSEFREDSLRKCNLED